MKIAVMGNGTVGKSLVKLLDQRNDAEVSYILELPEKCTEPRMVSDPEIFLQDPDIELVVDALPAVHPSYEFIRKALLAEKHVVTSNKAALCFGFQELMELAGKQEKLLKYEASCGGTIPCIKEAQVLSESNEITACYGIMNGTTNFILDNMIHKGSDFDDALARARRLGYAEADPTADLSGYDVKNKIVILSDTAYHGYVNCDFPVFGIEKISREILTKLAEKNKTIKLLGLSVREGYRYALGVVPVILPLASMEAEVPGNFNLFTLRCSNAGDIKLYGQGAGGNPTADAMVRDILSVNEEKYLKTKNIFDRKLQYDPKLLQGKGYIGKQVEGGYLEELMKIAVDENTFFAFEPDFL